MLNNRINIFGLVVYLCLQATHSFALDKKEATMLYFDLGEKGVGCLFEMQQKMVKPAFSPIYQKL